MIRIAVLERGPGLLTKHFLGPMRVVKELCTQWENNNKVRVIPLSNFITNLLQFRYENQLVFVRNLRHFLMTLKAKSCQFDIMNIHGVSEIGAKIAELCRRRKIPVVYTAHDAAYKEKELGYKYDERFVIQEERLVNLANKIIAVSPEVKKLIMCKYHLPNNKVEVIYNGIDPNFARRRFRKINIRKKYGIPENAKLILNIGGTRTVKDIPFLVESLSLLKRNDWHLVVIGGKGEKHDDVIRFCDEKIGGYYTFTGIIPETDLLNFYNDATLYVTSSMHEGFGLTPLEAMCFGIPVAIRSSIPVANLFLRYSEMRKSIFSTQQELADIVNFYLSEGKRGINLKIYNKIIRENTWQRRANDYLKIFEQLIV